MSGKCLRNESLRSRFVLQGEVFLYVVALAVLVLGVWVYLVERPAAATPFFSNINLFRSLPSVLGVVGNSMPTFAHAFSFSIFTALIMGATRRAVFWACLSWLLIGVAFEVGQHAVIYPLISDALALSGSLKSYFESGTFDPIDLLSILLGTMLAYLTLMKISANKQPIEPD